MRGRISHANCVTGRLKGGCGQDWPPHEFATGKLFDEYGYVLFCQRPSVDTIVDAADMNVRATFRYESAFCETEY